MLSGHVVEGRPFLASSLRQNFLSRFFLRRAASVGWKPVGLEFRCSQFGVAAVLPWQSRRNLQWPLL